MAKFGEWIEVKWRDMTEEEKESYPQYCAWADFEVPDDGDEILISRNHGKRVELVTFCIQCAVDKLRKENKNG